MYRRIAIVLIVICAFLMQEAEGRRKILKGRKLINRYYYREAAIPGWAILILVAVGEILLGGIIYLILKNAILDVPMKNRYSQANTRAQI